MFGGKLSKMGKGEMGKGEMGNHKDIEEKFKKEISKEVANLKEFLIQQGKEIVKIKQENKNLKDTVETRQSFKNDGSGVMSPEVRVILEKHQLALEKQKENTTKLSKLCLGTLNELEKFEKTTERENSVQSKRDSVIRESVPKTEPKVEEKLKRLTEENKKLIQLVTSLDQHVNTLEGKLNNYNTLDQHVQTLDGKLKGQEVKSSTSEITKEDVSKLVRENLEQAKQDNVEKDAQVQSLVAEVQNIIGQVRELGNQYKDLQDKVRRIEGDDGNERLGLEFAKTISRLEKVEREAGGGAQRAQEIGTFADDIAKRIEHIETDLRKNKVGADDIKRIVDKIEKDSSFTAESSAKRLGICEKGLDRIERESRIASDNIGQKIENVSRESKNLGESIKKKVDESDQAAVAAANTADSTARKLTKIEKDINNASAQENSNKSMLEQLTKKLDKLEKDEESSRDSRRQQNNLSMEDVKKDFNKLQEQLSYLEEKVLSLQKLLDGSTIESKNIKEKIATDIELLGDKVKNLSVTIKDDKFKNEEKLVKLEKQVELMNKDTTQIEKKVTNIVTAQSKIEKTLSSVGDASKSYKSDAETLKSEVKKINMVNDKNVKRIEENNGKIFDCIHDFESLKEALDKVSKKVDKRPAVEELDKKSELSNQLFNDLSTRIDDVESSNAKESKKSKTELDKINKDIKNIYSKQEDNNSQLLKDMTTLKGDMTTLKSSSGDIKPMTKDIALLKTENEKSNKEIKNMNEKTEEAKKVISSLQNEVKSLLSATDKIKSIEKDIEVIKKEKSSDKLISVEKECSSLRADHEKMNKDVKSISTEVKYIDSLLKKETTNTKTEISNFGKMLKSNDKDILSLQNMVEVLNDSLRAESTQTVNSEEINKIKTDITKVGADIKGCECKIAEGNDVIQKKIINDIKDIEAKIKNCKDELTQKVSTCISDIKNLGGKVDTNLKETKILSDNKESDKNIKTVKEDLEGKIKKSKDDVILKITSCTNDLKSLEKKMDTALKESKSQLDNKDVDNKIKTVKEELASKLTLMDTKMNTLKDDVCPKMLNILTETKALDKKVADYDNQTTKVQKSIENLQSSASSNRSNDDTKDMKKDIDKINQQIKDNLLKCDGNVKEVKSSIKEVNDKLVKLEKTNSDSKLKPATKDNSAEVKKEIDKINQQIKDNLKSCQDKGVQQEAQLREVKSSIKDVNDQLVVQVAKLSAKVEKDGRATPKPGAGAESAKLLTLSKAIDSIQDNTKSLETMVTKMKSEFSTSKDLEKLRAELKGGAMGDLQNHPDMGPIMDSLIMTNDRPFVDCSTITPMTGNGLVKFERFNAMNKLPWDDVGDQFVIQEPGVYCVTVTAILQDAGLSIKLASPMLEREVASLGSRDGLVGSSCPAFISRSALFHIDDDENCVETVLVEIHADNEDSFIDKNVTLTMFKIAEGTGQNDE